MSDTRISEQLPLPLGSDDLSVVCDTDPDPKKVVNTMGGDRKWIQKRLREVCRAVGGGTPSRTQPKFWNGEIPWASVKDFKDDSVFLHDTEEHITQEGLESSASTLIPESIPVVCTRMAVGRCALMTHPTAINQDLKALLLNGEFEPRFFIRLLRHHAPDLEGLGIGSTVRGISTDDLLALSIQYPDKPEQSRIAAVLDTVDGAITKTEAVIAKLKQVRAGLLHDLLTRGLDEHGQLRDSIAHPEQFQDSPLGQIPREWEVSTVGQLDLLIIDGDRGSNYPNESQLFEQGFCVFLNNRNIADGSVDFSAAQFISEERDSLLGKGKLNLGDIVITTRGTVGNIALFSDLHPYRHVRINSGMIILRAYENVFVPQFFVMLWRFLFPSEYRRLSSGSAQPQFPIRDIQQFRLLVPKRFEQERIVSASTSVESALAYERRALDKLKQLKSGLMSDLLTGRVRVPEGIAVAS